MDNIYKMEQWFNLYTFLKILLIWIYFIKSIFNNAYINRLEVKFDKILRKFILISSIIS